MSALSIKVSGRELSALLTEVRYRDHQRARPDALDVLTNTYPRYGVKYDGRSWAIATDETRLVDALKSGNIQVVPRTHAIAYTTETLP